jgi:hypothetical protein
MKRLCHTCTTITRNVYHEGKECPVAKKRKKEPKTKAGKAEAAVGRLNVTLAAIQERMNKDAEPLLIDLEDRAARRAARRSRRQPVGGRS